MYFTNLRGFLKKKNGQILDMGTYFDWIHVPDYVVKDIQMEFDQDKGEIYI